MRSVLEHLESDEAILLMYLSDELPTGDREQVEQRLARDEELRGQLDRLRAAQASIDAALSRLDAANPLPGSQAAHVRHVGRAVRQWQARRLAASTRNDAPRPALRFPYWSYPLAAAAAVTLAFVTWWYKVAEPSQLPVPNQIALDNSRGLLDSDRGIGATTTTANAEQGGLDPLGIAEPIEMLDVEAVPQFASLNDARALSELSELEEQIQQLQYLRETMQ